MAKNRQNNKEPELIHYLIKKKSGADEMIEVPANWKVTFSSVNPAQGMRDYGDGYCVRLYEGEKLRAVIGGATGLRDLSIPLMRKYSKESGQSTWESDSEGNFKRSSERQLESRWEPEEEDQDAPF